MPWLKKARPTARQLFNCIRRGDKVTYHAYAGRGRDGPEYKEATGRAALKGPAGWVLDVGGRYGERTAIVDEENLVAVNGRRWVGTDRPVPEDQSVGWDT